MNDDAIELTISHLEKRKRQLTHLLKLRNEVELLEKQFMSGSDDKFAVKVITEEVCLSFAQTFAALQGNTRVESVCVPRQVIFYLARELKRVPYKRIGEVFNKNHGTVIHGEQHIRDRMDSDPFFSMRINQIAGTAKRRLDAAAVQEAGHQQKIELHRTET